MPRSQEATALELSRGWEDWKLAFIPESARMPNMPKTVLIGLPMGNSVPKPRRAIVDGHERN
jgi:hypothetical protein